MQTYQNPIIPGFYPDPSICRVGEDYYLVNSSFEFFPGVPLWHSRDLIHWEQLGHVLTRESQLPLWNCPTSRGIYAPTIRFHNGRFYMITTNVSGGGNFFVWTDDILGEWSDPIHVDQGGIDPSLFWDDDGKVYYTGTFKDKERRSCIGQFEIDIKTGARLGETKPIWHGTGGKYPEGPHMYKINGWYYLLIAEGGTEYGHKVTIARSRSVWGPFESCPHNPILSHVDVPTSEFQATGHADIITDTEGKWWMVFHAIRPSSFMLHHVGRETMLAPVSFDEDGWPVVNGGSAVPAVVSMDEPLYTPNWSFEDDFSADKLHPRWSWLRNPDMSKYSFHGRGVTLHGGKHTLNDAGRPTFLGARQQLFDATYETKITLCGENGCAGITVFHTNEHHYDLLVKKQGSGLSVQLRRRVADMEVISEPTVFENTDKLTLEIKAERLLYTFFAGQDKEHLAKIGTGRSQLLSTEIMLCTYTGCFVGMFAEGEVKADFAFFRMTEE